MILGNGSTKLVNLYKVAVVPEGLKHMPLIINSCLRFCPMQGNLLVVLTRKRNLVFLDALPVVHHASRFSATGCSCTVSFTLPVSLPHDRCVHRGVRSVWRNSGGVMFILHSPVGRHRLVNGLLLWWWFVTSCFEILLCSAIYKWRVYCT